MNKLKKPLLFSLILLPIAIVGGIFTVLYQFDTMPSDTINQAIAQIGSKEILIAISVVQTCLYAVVLGFVGYLLAEITGLMRPFKLEKSPLLKVLPITAILGVIFSLDYFTFGSVEPLIQEGTKAGLSVNSIIASILYGGIIEEVMLRLFFLTLIYFILWKVFCRKKSIEEIPNRLFVTANIIAALMFAIGHLPATIMTFGSITPLILFRCILLNGVPGYIFGWIYKKYGIQYAMISHMGIHIISKLILFIFI